MTEWNSCGANRFLLEGLSHRLVFLGRSLLAGDFTSPNLPHRLQAGSYPCIVPVEWKLIVEDRPSAA
jgi:hypothetical protein